MDNLSGDSSSVSNQAAPPPNLNIGETVNPESSPQTSDVKQNFNFSSLGYKFSTQLINGKRIVSSFVSIFLLLVGLGAGVVLTTQPQLFGKKAQVNQNVSTPACDETAKCTTDALNSPTGSHPCLARSGVVQCCPIGQVIVNNACINVSSSCDPTSKCTLNSKTFGARPCSNSEGGISFCCSKGDSLSETLGFCYRLPF